MRKLYSIFSLCLLMLVSAMSAQAATTLGELELDKAYSFNIGNSGSTAQYTPTEDGVLTVTSTGSDLLAPFSDEACTTQLSYTSLSGQTATGGFYRYYSIDVTAGKTIYFLYNGLNSVNVTLSMSTGKSLSFIATSPVPGSTIMCTSTSQVSFSFDKPVECSKVEIVTSKTSKIIDFNRNTNKIFFEVKEPIYALMKAGSLAEGEEFSIRLTGVNSTDDSSIKVTDCSIEGENASVDANGVVTAKFICGAQPVSLVSNTNFSNTHSFKSFWTKGDADGIVTLTFSGDIKVGAENVKLTYGDTSSGSEASTKYSEVPPFTVNGNVLTIDLTDMERTPESMLGTTTQYDNMMLRVSNVTDLDGNPVYAEASGSRGSFTVNYPYVVETVNAQTQITPASGSSLANVDNITIFATDYKKFSFNGAVFSYVDDNNEEVFHFIDKEDLTEEASEDIEGAYTLTIPVPDEVKTKKDVLFCLSDLKAANGKNYSTLFAAKYNGFTVKSMTYQASADAAPQEINGAQLDSLVSDQPIVIQTNFDANVGNDSISYVGYSIEDLNPVEGDDNIIVSPTHIENFDKDANAWVGEVVGFGTTKLLLGHTYRVVVTGYQQIGKTFNMYRDIKVGSDTLYFYGTQADYVYSDINLESVTPTTITDASNFNLTVNFDGLVKIVEGATCIAGGGASENMYFDTYTPVDPVDGYSNEWVLGLSESKAKSQEARYATVNIAAEDQDGRRVKGNFGDRATSVTQQELFLSYNGAEITVTPASEETVSSLYTFDVTTPNSIGLSGSMELSEAYVYSRTSRQQVAVVASADPIYSADIQAMIDDMETLTEEEMQEKYGKYYFDKIKTNTMRLTLDKEITEAGTYMLYIPNDYFTSGEQFDSENSREFTGYYYIENKVPTTLNFSTDPENGSTVSELSTINLTFTDYEADDWGAPAMSYDGEIIVKKDGVEIGTASCEGSWDYFNQQTITLDVAQTEEGIYTIEIPEGYFLSGDGDALPAITLEFGIGKTTGIHNATTANGQKVVYNLQGVRVNGNKLPAGVYIINGKKQIVK